MKTQLCVNSRTWTLEIEPGERLLDTLRRLGHKGVKEGCGEGTCGACTVLLDGLPVNACLVFTAQAEGRAVTTIEGLGRPGQPHPIQEAYVEAGAVQCGYCTAGAILATKALLDRTLEPTPEQILDGLDGNLCRCTGYVKRVDAIQLAARKLAEERP